MLKHIPLDDYEEGYFTYRDIYNNRFKIFERYFADSSTNETDKFVKSWIDYDLNYFFDERGMERLVIMIAGMIFCMEHGGISDNDPVDLAYNVWLDIQDFNTGEFDDLFRPDDLKELKADIKKIMDYFDQHPKLKG